VACSGIKQALLEELAVFIIAENRITIVASQDDVERDAFGEVAGETGPIGNFAYKSSLTPFTYHLFRPQAQKADSSEGTERHLFHRHRTNA
jgi:hypothetical protein